MQRRYRSAFSRGQMTAEVRELEIEEDALDAMLGKSEGTVMASGRRASVSGRSEAPTPPGSPRAPSPARQIHTSTFPASSPPQAELPRFRRNSTSAVESPTLATESTSPPLADGDSLKAERRPQTERRPRTSKLTPTPVRRGLEAIPDASRHWYGEIQGALESRKYGTVSRAVQAYRRAPEAFSTATHNKAIDALRQTRLPDEPITLIVELYNDLFKVSGLRPNARSYELVVETFCKRDEDVFAAAETIENRTKKRALLQDARGPFQAGRKAGDEFLTKDERDAVALLRKDDYFTPALEIYKALGSGADRLDAFSINALIKAAARRGRVDLALTIFSRLEQSLFQRANAGTYAALIDMYGQVGDKEAALEVLEAYLAARAAGLRAPAPRAAGHRHVKVPVKHRHATEVGFEAVAYGKTFHSGGDEWIWRAAVKAVFAAGDPAGAVALLERMLAAQVEGNLPAGYPSELHSHTVAAVVRGFIAAGDVDSARTWFDRMDQTGGLADSFYASATYEAVSAKQGTLLNHIHRQHLAAASRTCKVSISDFMLVVDFNLATSFTTTDPAERQAALDAILEFRPKFEALVRQGGIVDGTHDTSFSLSSGMFQRLAAGYGLAGRYVDATEAFAELSNIVRNILARGGDAGFRSNRKWVLVTTEAAAGALGLKPRVEGASFEDVVPQEGISRPQIRQAATIIGWVNALRNAVSLAPVPRYELEVVQSYLLAKAAANGDVTQLDLIGTNWFNVIEAFAHVAAQLARGSSPAFEFPGFEAVIDDFVAAGVPIPPNRALDFAGVVRALETTGMAAERCAAVLHLINPRMAGQEREDNAAKEEAAKAAEQAVAEQSPLVQEALKVEPAPSAPESLPTPPATPPPYFAQLASAPAPVAFERIDQATTTQLDQFFYQNRTDAAAELARARAQEGRFAHPEQLARLVEVLGREGKLDKVRSVYLVAYEAVASMGSNPEAQSLAWINLEDKMIIALAQLGELNDVAVHRDRLYAAGSAPSADAYAAMILNMKETTDDAAVAVTIFEESQRSQVVPNVYLFNTLISKLSRARRAKDALVYFELMKQCGLVPSSITYGAIIAACCKAGDGAAAEYLFAEMTQARGFKPRVPPYNTMMQFFTQTRPDRERALQYFDQMLAAGVQPTGHTYKLLLDAYGSAGPADVASMRDIFSRLVADKHVAVTGAHWASLIHTYGSTLGDLDAARATFDSIAAHPSTARAPVPLPDAVVYEALLNACVGQGRPDLCEQYLGQMRHEGVRMTAYVANTLIKAHAAKGDLAAARAVFEGMQDPASGVAAAGNHPNARHAGHAVAGAGGIDAPVYREPSTWDIMVRAELGAGEVGNASALLKRMEERAFPDAVVKRVRQQLREVGAESL